MRSMPSWSRTKDSAVTSATSSASASASASPAWTPEAPEPEKKTFGQLKSSINMGSIGKKVGKAITLPGLKLGTSLTRESSAALGMFLFICFLINFILFHFFVLIIILCHF